MLKTEEKKDIITRLRENLAVINDKIKRSADRAKRDPAEIKLIVVTKTVETPIIECLQDIGITEVGENRVQSAEQKIPRMSGDLNWHMIGHLQTNKVKKALKLFNSIHSVDTLHLAETINQQAGNLNQTARVFIQVNTSKENTKYGLSPEATLDFYSRIAVFPHLNIQGLMTMAPFTDNPKVIRPCFKKLRKLLTMLQEKVSSNQSEFKYLSMGMSQDFELAVEEGAHILRIGTALFEGI